MYISIFLSLNLIRSITSAVVSGVTQSVGYYNNIDDSWHILTPFSRQIDVNSTSNWHEVKSRNKHKIPL